MEPAEKHGNSVLTGTSKCTAGNCPPIESGQRYKCYNAGWQRWQKWSVENFGKAELPANPMHVALYLQSLLKDCQQSSKSMSVIISAIYSIRWAHQTALMESPAEHILVKSVLNASGRILGKPVSPKEPLRLEIIKSIASYYCESEMSLASIRFLFVLLVGHEGMLRADELLSIRYKDIETSSSNMVIFIPKQKNDQHREGHYSNIKRSSKITCPVSFTEKLLDWLPDQKRLFVSSFKKNCPNKGRRSFSSQTWNFVYHIETGIYRAFIAVR